jgi:hypothetical protein
MAESSVLSLMEEAYLQTLRLGFLGRKGEVCAFGKRIYHQMRLVNAFGGKCVW